MVSPLFFRGAVMTKLTLVPKNFVHDPLDRKWFKKSKSHDHVYKIIFDVDLRNQLNGQDSCNSVFERDPEFAHDYVTGRARLEKNENKRKSASK